MANPNYAHVVFVDFENVPNVSLSAMEGQSAKVYILVGKNQKKLDLTLVQQALRRAPAVEIIEVGASGHNALDLTLAYYLGRAAATAGDAQFHIVSNDRDFDPLIAHLKKAEVTVHRHGEFSAQLFAPPARKSPLSKAPFSVPKLIPRVDKLVKLEAHLKNPASARPKSLKGLMAHISTAFGNKLDDAELQSAFEELRKRGTFTIDDKGKVRY